MCVCACVFNENEEKEVKENFPLVIHSSIFLPILICSLFDSILIQNGETASGGGAQKSVDKERTRSRTGITQ